MTRRERIEQKLRERLAAVHVKVIDESHLHAGHAGARESGGGHFRVTVVSPRFAGVGRVEAQRMVYAALAEEMGGEIHALALTTLAPEEQGGRPSGRPTRSEPEASEVPEPERER